MSNKRLNGLRIFRYFMKAKLYNQAEGSTAQIQAHSLDVRASWLTHWQRQGQLWRTEPEISPNRQAELQSCLEIEPGNEKANSPFKGMKLSRADIEWLLATYMSKYGFVDGSDIHEKSERKRLNLCGADLRQVNLQKLPLACIDGGLRWVDSSVILPEQYDTLAVRLDGANLSDAHLEGTHLRNVYLSKANLNGAYLEGACLWDAHLEGAELIGTHLEGAELTGAHLEGADMRMAHLEGAHLREAHLEDANLFEAHLEGAELLDAYMEKANLWSVHLENANLRRTRLTGADLWDAHLAGSDLRGAHIEGVNLREAHLEGKELSSDDVKKLQRWCKDVSALLPPANLQRAFFDIATVFRDTTLGEKKFGFVSLADARWGDVNLSVIDWSSVNMLGDEREARQQKKLYAKTKTREEFINEYRIAVRANRQLAIVLQSQGLNEEGAKFAYRAQVLQRTILRLEQRIGSWIFSLLLAILAGYGYRMGRLLFAYGIVVTFCALAYFALGHYYLPHLDLLHAFLESITAFHGRVFLEVFNSSAPQIWITAFEAVVGLVIEGVFIAMLTQRFFSR